MGFFYYNVFFLPFEYIQVYRQTEVARSDGFMLFLLFSSVRAALIK